MSAIKYSLSLLALVLIVLAPGMAAAALGEQESSVSEDAARIQGVIKTQALPLYRVHEIQTPGGTVVREFVSLSGRVFAVTWRGPFMPNLKQTLGSYFDNYVAASALKEAHHRRVQVHQDDLVVESAGHMRAFAGRAYLPPSVPAGVEVGELQ